MLFIRGTMGAVSVGRAVRTLLLLLTLGGLNMAAVGQPAPLVLESKISLGDIRGRIDHLAVDLKRQRLYVAELGNDSVGVVDLKEQKTIRTLAGLNEPQGIGYVPSTDTVYVANAGNGSVRLLQGEVLTPIGEISLGSDADNVRVDDAANRVFIGYGSGAIAVIDTTTRRKLTDLALKDHPESFQLEPSGDRIFVNVPGAHQIAVINRQSGQPVAVWKTPGLASNYSLAIDMEQRRVIAVFRHPPTLGVFAINDGRLLNSVKTCSDADDVFIDSKRRRIYVICGEGFVDVLTSGIQSFEAVARVTTVSGARTGLFIPELDRLVVAVRAAGGAPAALWVFKPTAD